MKNITSISPIFGTPEIKKKIKGFPEGKIKIKFRNNEYARAFVKNNFGIKMFYLGDSGEFWVPFPSGKVAICENYSLIQLNETK